eukprot:1547762-Pyramimonas_sp.AAC.1
MREEGGGIMRRHWRMRRGNEDEEGEGGEHEGHAPLGCVSESLGASPGRSAGAPRGVLGASLGDPWGPL